MKMLSPRQSRILDFLREFIDKKDRPPTIRDIQYGCNISSTSVVEYNLRILEREGHIRRDREVSRGIGLSDRKRLTVRVPVIGYIAAGEPVPVPSAETWNSEPLELLELTSDLTRGRDKIYALKVRGTSMIDALIGDGDLVLMEPAATVENGDMAAVWLKGEKEATLKRFYREAGRIRLQPANEQLKPFYVDPDDVEIQGKVIGVVRRL
jgi:repressor LexA